MKELPQLPIGNHQLICKAEGYKTKTIDITITENETITQNITLEPGNDFVEVNFNLDDSYDLYVDGKAKGTVFGGKELETGKHTIELHKDGESIKSVVFIDDKNSNTISLGSKSKAGIIWQSALLPGLGQITHGRAVVGGIYMGIFAGTATYHYLNMKNYYNAKGELEVITNRYNSATDPTDKYNLSLEMTNKQSDLDDAYKKVQTSIWFPIGAYAISLLDAILFPTPKVIKIANNRTLQIVPNLALLPNDEVNAGLLVRF
jgi:hypothetical protein